ncbi:MAG: inositol-3-phosphate synthase [Nitrospirae bacterium]|nr:inositol-3-phosphate synthase [Nitrospirota bacterium]
MDKRIRLGIVGVGNCASSLLQGIEYYTREGAKSAAQMDGLLHREIGGYRPESIEVVCAFDVDKRKVGRPVHEAIFAPPNCTKVFCGDFSCNGTRVSMGPVLDGVASHMAEYPEDRTFLLADTDPVDVERTLRETGCEILVNYLPVGSEKAAQAYATACLAAGVGMVNCIPVFIASNSAWAAKFQEKGLPIVGDDVKSQLGATILHRTLARLFRDRGVKIERTYQMNAGGNTDFLNMLARERLTSKKISKTEAVQSQLAQPLPAEDIHIGPSDYVPWLKDNKLCFLRIEARGFGGVPLELEARLSVEDSPNSAGVAIDAIRCCKLARDRKVGGPLTSISACTMKHPPVQISDERARQLVRDYIEGRAER